MDPSRPVTLASHRRVNGKALQYLDVISLNFYYCWYTEWSNIEEGTRKTVEEVEKIHNMFPAKPIIITEFGADAVTGLHYDPPLMWTEEYKPSLLEGMWRNYRGKAIYRVFTYEILQTLEHHKILGELF